MSITVSAPQTVLLVTSTEDSARCPYKNHILTPYTLNWARQELPKHPNLVLHYLGDNSAALAYCKANNIPYTYRPKGAGHIADILHFWRHSGHPDIVLAQPTQPLREHWLLTDTLATLRQYPSHFAVTAARGSYDDWRFLDPSPDGCASYPAPSYATLPSQYHANRLKLTGSLFVFSSRICRILSRLSAPTSASLTDLPTRIIEHNPYCALDIDAPHQLPTPDDLARRMSTAHYLGRPLHLPTEVTLVGSNSSIANANGADIDSRLTIRVNHIAIDPPHTGTRVDYHLTKYPHTILEDEANAKYYPAPKLIAGRWVNYISLASYWEHFDHTTDPSVEQITHAALAATSGNPAMTDPNAFVSTGMYAIYYALTHGARRLYLAGYGGHQSDHTKTAAKDHQEDVFAQQTWLAREDAHLRHLEEQGIVHHLD